MDFSVYARPRRFRLPHLRTTAAVGPSAVLWALLTGPFYFWRKGALIEAIVIAAATLPFWAVDSEGPVLDAISGLVWLGAVLFAPVLLMMSYERRGWVEVTTPPRALDIDDGDSLDSFPGD